MKMELIQKILIFVFLEILISSARSYKILGVFPLAVKSHDIFCQSVTKALAKRGHQVDVIVIRELENPPENYTVIYNMLEIVQHMTIDLAIDQLISNYSSDPVKYISHQMGNSICELLANEKIQKMIENFKRKADYDLMVVEAFGINCFMGLAHFLNIPMITLSAQSLYPWVEDAIGNPTTTATHPTILSTMLEINSFWDRLQNTIEKLVMKYKFYYRTDKIQTELIRKYISPDLPTVRELAKNSILTLSNTHFTFNGIKSTTPALIKVAGLHILQDETKFTPEMQKWMDESDHGVIYFSLGTVLLIDSLPKDKFLIFYSVIKKLKPIRFLIRVKYANNIPPGIPENLKTLPWIPQIPVLSHKNTRAFITHCGLFSSLEAIHFGVPVVGVPMVADQFFNMDQLVKKNMAIKLNLSNITEKILYDTLMLVLNNSLYRDAAKRASNLFQDRPMNAENTTIYWIEYVLRNGGISKSSAVNLHWTQRELLDIYGFLILLFIFILCFITKLIRKIFNSEHKNELQKMKEKYN